MFVRCVAGSIDMGHNERLIHWVKQVATIGSLDNPPFPRWWSFLRRRQLSRRFLLDGLVSPFQTQLLLLLNDTLLECRKQIFFSCHGVVNSHTLHPEIDERGRLHLKHLRMWSSVSVEPLLFGDFFPARNTLSFTIITSI